MNSNSSSVLLVTIPINNDDSTAVGKTFDNIKSSMSSYADMGQFKIPHLNIGTLDSLMTLSDDLDKIKSNIENVVRKIERQYVEINDAPENLLEVCNFPVEKYIVNYEWDEARIPYKGKSLREIVAGIQDIAIKADGELKLLAASYQESTTSLTTLERRQIVNLTTSDFEDFLKPKKVSEMNIINTATLKTVIVIVPKALNKEFLNIYSTLADDVAVYGETKKTGPKSGRSKEKGSPVVPESHKLVDVEDNDNYLYTILILKGHTESGYYDKEDQYHTGKYVDYTESIRVAFREKRFILRDWAYDGDKAGTLKNQISDAEKNAMKSKKKLIKWCSAHFGDTYSAWIHAVVVKAYAESILRYGLKMQLLSTFVQPLPKREKQAKTVLSQVIGKRCPDLATVVHVDKDGENENDGEEDVTPYVCESVALIGSINICNFKAGRDSAAGKKKEKK